MFALPDDILLADSTHTCKVINSLGAFRKYKMDISATYTAPQAGTRQYPGMDGRHESSLS